MVAGGTTTIRVGSAVMAGTMESCAEGLPERSTTRLCTASPGHDNCYFPATMDKHTFCAAAAASSLAHSLTSMTATARSKAMQPLKKQSNPKILKLHRLAGILHRNKPATAQDNERPENQQHN